MGLAEVRKRLEAASTELPWTVHPITQLIDAAEDDYVGRGGVWVDGPNWIEADEAMWFDPVDASLIAHAPTDLALLIDVAEAARLAACLPRTKGTSAVLSALDEALAKLEASS